MNPTEDPLIQAAAQASNQFQDSYRWLEKAMPLAFFEEVKYKHRILITHNLMGFDLQNYYSTINLKQAAIVICLDSADADLRILKNYSMRGIKNYQIYISKMPAPFPGITRHLRIAMIEFTGAEEPSEKSYSIAITNEMRTLLKERNQAITDGDFDALLNKLGPRFASAMPTKRLILAMDMLFRAEGQDNCQYVVEYDQEWASTNAASMQVVLAWRNTQKHDFLFRMARVIHHHGISIRRVNATYVDPYGPHNVLVMVLSLHGSNGQAVWDVADANDFLRELVTFKYFTQNDTIENMLVHTGIISGNMGHLLQSMISFIHQLLIQVDHHQYRLENIEEALYRHPELTMQLCECFKLRFDPEKHDAELFETARQKFLDDVNKFDTGREENDARRKSVLIQAINFITYTLKTNFYRSNYTALSFRLHPNILDHLPFDRTKKFPEKPYAIFFIKGLYFFGFHIRFKDLARGGLRTIYPDQYEQMVAERNHVFTECYNLALTQQKKNKEIPEGGSKGVIFLETYIHEDSELQIFKKEWELSQHPPEEIESHLASFHKKQKLERLYCVQRAFIESFVTLINCDPDGKIRAKHIVDYWQRPEYIYLGPDENMHDSMIEWIAKFSKKYHYKPEGSFISSKTSLGINHKEFGVTSLGINVYMHKLLEAIGINPSEDIFTIKMSGGPDGDVAGNQLLNLYRYYPSTAKLVALTDGTGTINDPAGVDLEALQTLFYETKGIAFYDPGKLSEGGLLLVKSKKRQQSTYSQETLCYRKVHGRLVEEWLSGNEMNHLLRYNLHQTRADVFIPAGGRPKTLNDTNIHDFLDAQGKPTAKAIVEGANLYLTPKARHFLEDLGVLIIKDSSANKGGVICSSFEILSGLTLTEEQFRDNKPTLVSEILDRVKFCAEQEAHLLIQTYKKTGKSLTTISEKISEKMNQFKYQLLDYLDPIPLSHNIHDPLIHSFLSYCLPILRKEFTKQLLEEIPDHHKKAVIACHLAAAVVYNKGIDWSPSIVDILPLILENDQE